MSTEDNIIELIDLFSSNNTHTRFRAIEKLAKIGKPAIPYLLVALDNSNWLVRFNVVRTISLLKDNSKETLHKLSSQLKKETDGDVSYLISKTIRCLLMSQLSLKNYLFPWLTHSKIHNHLIEFGMNNDSIEFANNDNKYVEDPFSEDFSEDDALKELLALKTCQEILDKRALEDEELAWLWGIKKKVAQFCIKHLESILSHVDEDRKVVSLPFREEIIRTHPLLQGKDSLRNFSVDISREWVSQRVSAFITSRYGKKK